MYPKYKRFFAASLRDKLRMTNRILGSFLNPYRLSSFSSRIAASTIISPPPATIRELTVS
jgi:hypothetical protein